MSGLCAPATRLALQTAAELTMVLRLPTADVREAYLPAQLLSRSLSGSAAEALSAFS